MEFTTLSNGVKAPLLGVGTYLLSLEDTEKSVYEAIRCGYRLIDTANGYLNEAAVGRAVARAINEGLVKREELFISTKLWPTVYEKETAVDETLKRLGLDYVDLLFIHQPAGNFIAGYEQLEKAYKEGKAKSIGISNFHGKKLEKLLAAADIKPHVIQLETHPYFAHHEQMDRLKEYGTKLMGWYPLGHGDAGLLHEKIFEELAAKYHKNTVQILLRWAVQYGVMTIPGSKNPEHIRSNFDIFDFSLTDEEMKEIAKLDGTKRYYHPDDKVEESYATMHLCFEK
ncbi:MAG: aldo/keto reductase [Mitsuokella sp.]|uniref:aldo/keto reductase n=1 Tax=Mitsuokella sp. TaxID=2049034 RepID=UPI003F02C749